MGTIGKKYKIVPVKGTEIEETKINFVEDAVDYAKKFYHEDIEIYESAFALFLTRANKVKAYIKISQGGTVGTVIDPILITKYAIDTLSKSVILIHNHPSGNLTPSKSDEIITSKVLNGLKLFEINLLDHIILSPDFDYYSFANENESFRKYS